MTTRLMTTQRQAPYEQLTPDLILTAIESVGAEPGGGLLGLNSYENRVYQMDLNEGGFIIAKFYRPDRWTDEAILEEHQFAFELQAQDIPIIPPDIINGKSLFEYGGYRFSLYPRRGGRWPELSDPAILEQLGRLIGRIHATGRTARFEHRQTISVAGYGQASLDYIIEHDFVPPESKHNFTLAAQTLLAQAQNMIEAVQPFNIRIHGDFHPGNILSTGEQFHFVDLDDCVMGPAIQDLWMLLSGEQHEMTTQMNHVLKGYEMFCEFDRSELVLIEALRALRLVYYCGWLARRWHDPAFPQHFPWFNTPRYWEEQMITFREQLERCQMPALDLG